MSAFPIRRRPASPRPARFHSLTGRIEYCTNEEGYSTVLILVGTSSGTVIDGRPTAADASLSDAGDPAPTREGASEARAPIHSGLAVPWVDVFRQGKVARHALTVVSTSTTRESAAESSGARHTGTGNLPVTDGSTARAADSVAWPPCRGTPCVARQSVADSEFTCAIRCCAAVCRR